MAEVRAFRGIRYDAATAGGLADVVCAPYDVSQASQAACYARSAHNCIRLELGRDEPGDDADENKYTRAARYLREWLRTGVLRADETPALYVYEEAFSDGGLTGRRRGFFAAVRLEEWASRVVLPHERTMAGPKADRLSLLRACRANLSPVFSLYEDPSGQIAEALEAACRAAPVAAFELRPGAVTAAADRHRLWRLHESAAVAEVQRRLAGRPLFIADGHHRYETALQYWREAREAGAGADHPAAWVLMLLADAADPGLAVLPTHRMARAPGLDRGRLLRDLGNLFVVEEWYRGGSDSSRLESLLAEMGRLGGSRASPGAEPVHAFGVAGLAPGALHLLTARPGPALDARLPSDRSAAWRGLDVGVLHGVVLDGLLRLGGLEQGDGDHLAYTRDAAEALSAVASGDYDLAFFLNPTRVSQIRDVALSGDRMPEKSTYFWPKPPTGVVFYAHDEA